MSDLWQKARTEELCRQNDLSEKLANNLQLFCDQYRAGKIKILQEDIDEIEINVSRDDDIDSQFSGGGDEGEGMSFGQICLTIVICLCCIGVSSLIDNIIKANRAAYIKEQCRINNNLLRVNRLSGVYGDFKRSVVSKRPAFNQKLSKYNIFYFNERSLEWDVNCGTYENYWTDSGKLEFQPRDEIKAMKASMELHSMMLEAVDEVVKDDKLKKLFQIPEVLWKPMNESWSRKDFDLQGRFDFSFDFHGNIKLLEYNADTPSI